jgi:hypothetical protein
MAEPSSSPSLKTFVGISFISLLAGLLIALFFIPHRKTTHVINVIPGNPVTNGPTVSPDPEPIYYHSGDVVNWRSAPGSRVAISFKADNFDPNSSSNTQKEPPFIGGSPGNDQDINCLGNSCTSLNINLKLEYYLKNNPGKELTYKYWQTLDNQKRDGKIIIRW